MNTDIKEGFYNTKQVAQKFRVTKATIKNLVVQNKIDSIKIGNSIRFPEYVMRGILKKNPEYSRKGTQVIRSGQLKNFGKIEL